TIEVRCLPFAGHGHADAGRDPLAEWPGRGLHAAGPAIFRMAGAFAIELAEAFDVVQLHGRLSQPFVLRVHRFDARAMKQRAEKHRRVTHRQHEAIAVGPDRIDWVEAEKQLSQAVSDW